MKWFGDNYIVKYFVEVEKLFKNLGISEEGKRDMVLEHANVGVQSPELRYNLYYFRSLAPTEGKCAHPDYTYAKLKELFMRWVEQRELDGSLRARDAHQKQ